MRVSEALPFFENIPKVRDKLQVMYDVGLSYITLGQGAPTLSGGEAGRVKLAKELQKKPTGKSVFILDEPTTGLHSADIKKLLEGLNIKITRLASGLPIGADMEYIDTLTLERALNDRKEIS